MIEVTNLKQVDELLSQNKFTVFFNTASWCTPCQKIKKVFPEIEQKYSNINFYLVDVDGEEFPFVNEVTAMPTFLLFVGKNSFDKVVGASRELLESSLNNMLKEYMTQEEVNNNEDEGVVNNEDEEEGS